MSKRSVRTYRGLLLTHILSCSLWLGWAAFSAFVVVTAGVGNEAPGSMSLVQSGVLVSVGLGVIAYVSGVLLGVTTKWGLARYAWVMLKIGIATAVLVTDAVIVRNAAASAVLSGTPPRQLIGASVAHVVMLSIAVVLSVLKPRFRVPAAPRSLRSQARPA